jgi:hypothetical protein
MQLYKQSQFRSARRKANPWDPKMQNKANPGGARAVGLWYKQTQFHQGDTTGKYLAEKDLL